MLPSRTRNGSVAGNGSGDLFIAFSTANPDADKAQGTLPLTMMPNDRMTPLFEASAQATEESIILRRHHRLAAPPPAR